MACVEPPHFTHQPPPEIHNPKLQRTRRKNSGHRGYPIPIERKKKKPARKDGYCAS